jgi:NAD(P)-dependent dehydrogenase (short-subunit alcohol dehydrogenase family)
MSQKVCAIVGAGPGVGLAVAKRFAREGFCCALLARRADALSEYVNELKQAGVDGAHARASLAMGPQAAPNPGAHARAFTADASDPASLEGALKSVDTELGPPEVLVYNAAVLKQGPPTSLDADALIADFKVNVAGALVCAKHVAASMRAQKRGTILFTGGGLALTPFPQFSSLAIGKAGIRSLAYSLAGELEPEGIHVATVTICGMVKPGTRFDPDAIADVYYTLYTQEPGKWEREVVFK